MAFIAEKRTITPRPKTMRDKAEREEMTREDKMISALSPNLNIMVKAVRKAGRRMVRDFGEVANLQFSQKAPGDFVSNSDVMSEKVLREILSEARPDCGFWSEEMGEVAPKNGVNCRFIIDPIDGTINFLHAVPYFSISVALQMDGEIIAGVTYNPVTSELYYAEKGKGAFLMTPTGNTRLRVSGRRKLSHALVGSNGFVNEKNRNTLDKFLSKVASVRYNGSTTLGLASVAAGQTDLYFANQFKPCDVAVGLLLVREAGGYIGTYVGETDLDTILKKQEILSGNMTMKELAQKVIGS